MFTTIQDTGRPGYRRFGIPESGAMDGYNAMLANWLVCNKIKAPLLEITMTGPRMKFNITATVAITGADMSATINGKPASRYHSLIMVPGDELRFGRLKKGCRAYLAVTGGFKAETFLDSCSTYTLAEKGGIEGRPLKAGDQLIIRGNKYIAKEERMVPEFIRTKFTAIKAARYVRGPEADFIDEESPMDLSEKYTIHPESDRMGIRLSGFFGEVRDKEIISSPVNKGTIQLLPDDNLIVLMNDGQVSGGYPRLGNIIAADLHLLAQLKPGDRIKLMPVSVAEAESLYRYQVGLLKKYQ